MISSFRTKLAAAGIGLGLVLSLSGVTQATAAPGDAYPPGVTPVTCKIKKLNGAGKVKINMGPNQPGDRFYSFKMDVKKRGEWYRYLKKYNTEGPKETKKLTLPKGKYRAHCIGKYGYTTANSKTVKLNGGKAVSCQAKTVDGKNKIKVNVGPNLSGDKYYSFKIDVKKNGKWFRYNKGYKTQGPKETKTINLPEGKYRAHCFGKYAYGWANSNAVQLTR